MKHYTSMDQSPVLPLSNSAAQNTGLIDEPHQYAEHHVLPHRIGPVLTKGEIMPPRGTTIGRAIATDVSVLEAPETLLV